MVAASCATSSGSHVTDDSPCFIAREIESSRIVLGSCAERTEIRATPDIHPDGLAVRGSPGLEATASAPATPSAPTTGTDALKLAVRLLLDAGDLDAAAEVIALMKRAKPKPVAHLEAVRARRDDDGKR